MKERQTATYNDDSIDRAEVEESLNAVLADAKFAAAP